MRERLITLACALGALFLFLTLFVHGASTSVDRTISRPTTQESGGNGYRGAMEWLQAEGVHAISLRERFSKLPKIIRADTRGNILLVTLPVTTAFRTEEFRALDRWVRAGNTLLVAAALDDSPDWAVEAGGLAATDLRLLTGLEFETVRARETRERNATHVTATATPLQERDRIGGGLRRFGDPRREILVPNRSHPYFADVREAVGLSDFPAQPFSVRIPYEGFVFALAHEQSTGEGALWVRPLGEGRILVSAFGSVFTNRALRSADNGQLLANIVSANLGPGGTVLFDDTHQGLGAAYDPEQFWRDPRLHATTAVLALLWLAWIVGYSPLRAAIREPAGPEEADLVRTTGGFLARVLTPAAAARRLIENFLRALPGVRDHRLRKSPFSSFEVEQACADLQRQATLAPADVEQLRAWYNHLDQSRPVPLSAVHNLIVRLTKQLKA